MQAQVRKDASFACSASLQVDHISLNQGEEIVGICVEKQKHGLIVMYEVLDVALRLLHGIRCAP